MRMAPRRAPLARRWHEAEQAPCPNDVRLERAPPTASGLAPGRRENNEAGRHGTRWTVLSRQTVSTPPLSGECRRAVASGLDSSVLRLVLQVRGRASAFFSHPPAQAGRSPAPTSPQFCRHAAASGSSSFPVVSLVVYTSAALSLLLCPCLMVLTTPPPSVGRSRPRPSHVGADSMATN